MYVSHSCCITVVTLFSVKVPRTGKARSIYLTSRRIQILLFVCHLFLLFDRLKLYNCSITQYIYLIADRSLTEYTTWWGAWTRVETPTSSLEFSCILSKDSSEGSRLNNKCLIERVAYCAIYRMSHPLHWRNWVFSSAWCPPSAKTVNDPRVIQDMKTVNRENVIGESRQRESQKAMIGNSANGL